jgi:type IV secretory pathway TrbF-like protein
VNFFNFGKKDNALSGDAAIRTMGNAPQTAYQKAEGKFYEIYGSSKVESSRWFVFSMVLLVVVIALALSIAKTMPLKTVVPYIVQVDKVNGAAAHPVSAVNFSPDTNVKSYFLSQWVYKLLTIDPFLTRDNIKAAYLLTRDKASKEYTEYLNEDKPIERLVKDPSLTRTVRINSLNPGAEQNIAIIRVTTEERSGTSAVKVKRYMLTIHYAIVPPTTEEEIRVNPVGIYITHFVINEEIV